MDEKAKFGIYQGQLSRAWCLVYPYRARPVEWFSTFEATRQRYINVVNAWNVEWLDGPRPVL